MSLPEKRINHLLEALSSAVSRIADEASPKSVHRLRTTIRRIESLVAFAGPELGRKQQRTLEHLAALRKRAGKVRDLDVQMDLLGAIANGSTAGDRHVLADVLKRKRSRQVERLGSAICKLQDSKFFSYLERIGEKTSAVFPEAMGLPVEQARQQLSGLAAEVTSQQPIKPRFLHQVRIRMKMIRYLAESGDESADQQRFLNALESAQDALGAWHDWEALAKIAEKQFGGRVNCPLLMEITALLATRYSAAMAAVAHLFSLDSAAPERKQPGGAEKPKALARPA
jgi:CHAD domain-containing protein